MKRIEKIIALFIVVACALNNNVYAQYKAREYSKKNLKALSPKTGTIKGSIIDTTGVIKGIQIQTPLRPDLDCGEYFLRMNVSILNEPKQNGIFAATSYSFGEFLISAYTDIKFTKAANGLGYDYEWTGLPLGKIYCIIFTKVHALVNPKPGEPKNVNMPNPADIVISGAFFNIPEIPILQAPNEAIFLNNKTPVVTRNISFLPKPIISIK